MSKDVNVYKYFRCTPSVFKDAGQIKCAVFKLEYTDPTMNFRSFQDLNNFRVSRKTINQKSIINVEHNTRQINKQTFFNQMFFS